MRILKFLTKVKSSRLFTRTPAHKSSEALKAEAMTCLDSAVTHAEFREVLGLVERIIVRFEEDERIDAREAQFRSGRAQPPQQQGHQHQQKQHHHNQNGKNHHNGGGKPYKQHAN